MSQWIGFPIMLPSFKRHLATWIALFFFIKCKNQKEAGDQQYKEKETKSLDQIRSKTSLLNRRQREQTPLYKPQARQAC
jgi:hypothetical protein